MPHVMLIEGDALVRALIAHRLMDRNWRVTALKDARYLEQMLADEPADLLLIDLGLPHSDGFSVVERLLAKAITPPAFIITAYELPHIKAMALGAGASGVIHKPFDEDELIAKAEVLLAA